LNQSQIDQLKSDNLYDIGGYRHGGDIAGIKSKLK